MPKTKTQSEGSNKGAGSNSGGRPTQSEGSNRGAGSNSGGRPKK